MSLSSATAFFSNEINHNIANTIVATIVLIIVYVITYSLLKRNLQGDKAKQRFRARLFYALSLFLLLVITKIWVNGFTQFLAILSFVSAALVIANKELVQNFVGGLIINWRALFAEGDFIQLQQFSGFVHDIGILYFKLLEVSPTANNRVSGRMIKVPNSLIISNVLINYSNKTNFLEYHLDWLFTPESDLQLAKKLMYDVAKKVINKHYAENHEYSTTWSKHVHKNLADFIDLDIHVTFEIKQQSPSGHLVRVTYYCYPIDRNTLTEKIMESIFEALAKQPTLKLVYQTG